VTFGLNDTTRTFTVHVPAQEASVVPDQTVIFGLRVPPGAAALGATKTATLKILGHD
jgi:hypothetical protein